MKVKDIVREDNTMYKVIKNDPTTGIDLQHPDDPHSTLHLDPEAAKAIAANPDNPNQFTINPAIAGAAGADAPQGPQGPQQGAEVEMPATEDYELEQDMMQKGHRNRGIGGDATDNYINDVTDHDFEKNAHEDFLNIGNKSPEEWAKTSKQMAELLKLQKAYQGTQYQSQIEKRIQILKDRLDMDAGEVAGPGGIPKPVVPPEKFKQFNEDGEVPAIAPLSPEQQAQQDKSVAAMTAATAGLDDKKDDIMGTGMDAMIKTLPPEDQQQANEFIVRNPDGTVDGDETMMKMADAMANLGSILYEAFSKLPNMLETAIQNKDPDWVSLPPEKQQEILKDIEDMKAWLPKWKADMDKASAEWEKQKPVMRQQVDQRANDRFKNKTGMDMVRGGAGQKTNIGTDPNNPGGPAGGIFESADDKLLKQMLSIAGLR